MKFIPGLIYHIYKRGNNKQKIFFNERNYQYFREKLVIHVADHCDLLAYCLMPNHFHLMIRATEKTILVPEKNKISKTVLSDGIRVLLSSYSRAINIQENRTGSLFTQNTNAKLVLDLTKNTMYPEYCFLYIHHNPYNAGLVSHPKDWPYSSYNEYIEPNAVSICNTNVAKKILNIDWDNFQAISDAFTHEEKYIKQIF